MADRLSNKAVAALIIVTIIVTVAGTLFFLNSAEEIWQLSMSDQSEGQVFLGVSKDRPIVFSLPEEGQITLQVV